MTPRKVSIYIACPSYGGNGGISSLHPDVARWLVGVTAQMRADERIEHVYLDFEADCPITMVRNNYVVKARKEGCDFLLMVDSDQSPDKHQGEPWFKPFWGEAFNEAYSHFEKGPLVIGAPYCGPPNGTENAYVFYWENNGFRGDETSFRLEQYPRQWAAQMSGIQECAALPTGMILCDIRIFEMLDPCIKPKRQVLNELAEGTISVAEAEQSLGGGWFYYEYKNGYCAEKASTEDVAFTRDASLIGMQKLGYNPVRCAWDSWAGHIKPWNVGKPCFYGIEQIGDVYKKAISGDVSLGDKRVEFKATDKTMSLFGVK